MFDVHNYFLFNIGAKMLKILRHYFAMPALEAPYNSFQEPPYKIACLFRGFALVYLMLNVILVWWP